jgi:hypothetical protein
MDSNGMSWSLLNQHNGMRSKSNLSSFDILRILIKHEKLDELSYETFTDAINEFSSDRYEQRKLALGLSQYLESIEYYNFSDVKKLSANDRERLARAINHYLIEYLDDHPHSGEWNKNLDGGSVYDDDE